MAAPVIIPEDSELIAYMPMQYCMVNWQYCSVLDRLGTIVHQMEYSGSPENYAETHSELLREKEEIALDILRTDPIARQAAIAVWAKSGQ